MDINSLVLKSHRHAMDKGFWREFQDLMTILDSNRPGEGGQFIPYIQNMMLSQKLMLMAEELIETHEEVRNGRPVAEIRFSDDDKPEGIPIELADVIIRVCDLAGFYGIDLDQAIRMKMDYNARRPFMHGRQF